MYEKVETLEITMNDLELVCVQIVYGLDNLADQIKCLVPFPVDVFPLKNVEQASQFAKLKRNTESWPHADAVEGDDARALHQADF
jgi:hypothetical protein